MQGLDRLDHFNKVSTKPVYRRDNENIAVTQFLPAMFPAGTLHVLPAGLILEYRSWFDAKFGQPVDLAAIVLIAGAHAGISD
ncbi:hypothetical protein GCM10007870_29620 [Gluconobacter kondonii]|uniref:Uncharacterized protein n=1 Tax=Gluconobacter kondonii TaxID=941463 RepID=A0ABQ5WV24_9PROT|nr:hypothetical protein AA3266_2443 [Gluconobacter kondonii NBRC 3266]GLQ67377.1 hypothetical protein GCM10007870_29620 [Gluconobacter kondonii]